MSADTVDDLHAAEDMAGTFANLLDRIVKAGHLNGDADLASHAISAVAQMAGYCRPTCGAEGDPEGECDSGDPSTCGCPCRHADAEGEPS